MGLASDRAEEHAALLRLAAGGFRDMTRIASGHPAIWLDICAENRPAILSALDGLIERAGRRCATSSTATTAAALHRAAAAGPRRAGQPAQPGQPAERAGRGAHPDPGPPRRRGRGVHARRRARRQHRQLRSGPQRRGQPRRRRRARRRGDGRAVPRRADGARATGPPCSGCADGGRVPRRTASTASARRRRRLCPGSKSIANRALVCAALADGESRRSATCPTATTPWRCSTASAARESASTRSDEDGASVTFVGIGRRGLRPGPIDAADAAGRHDVAVRHRARRARAGTVRRSTVIRRCARGRWRRCTTRSSRSGRPCRAGEALGPPAGHGARPGSRCGRRRSRSRRRQQPVHHRADADRPVLAGRSASRLSRPARVAPVPADHRGGDGRRSGTTASTIGERHRQFRRAAYGPTSTTRRARRQLGQLPARRGGDLRRHRRGPGLDRRLAAGRRRVRRPARRRWGATSTSATPGRRSSRRGDRLRGIDVDMADISDLVPTLAVVAPFADTPTRIRGVGFIRAKESDRLGDLCAELRRLGADADRDRRRPDRSSHPTAARRTLRHPPRPPPGDGVRPRRPACRRRRRSTIPTSSRRAGPATGTCSRGLR